jgi:mono/diheme cytochrome c family protein
VSVRGQSRKGAQDGGIMQGARVRLALFATLCGLASTGRAAEPAATLVDAGRESFQRYCAACHGVNATGDGPVAPSLKTPPPDLTAIAQRRGGTFPAGEIATYIDGRFAVAAHGTRLMPVWGRLLGAPISEGTTADEVSRGRIDALVSYLQTIQK